MVLAIELCLVSQLSKRLPCVERK